MPRKNPPPPLMFEITSAMRLKLERWLKTHCCEGSVTYSFTPCGIGDGIKASCPCGKSLDLTDIDSW